MEQNYVNEFFAIMHKMAKLRIRNGMGGPIPPGQFLLLTNIYMKLKAGIKINITDISTELQMSKPIISRMLNSLEERNLLMRSMEKFDRRMVNIQLTESGKLFVAQAIKKQSTYFEDIFNMMSEEKIKCLISLMKELYGYAKLTNENYENANKNNKITSEGVII